MSDYSGKDFTGKVKGDECPKLDRMQSVYDGAGAGLVVEHKKNDGELTNGYVPSVRKTGSVG